MKPLISVIIPVKDDTLRLMKCLEALESQNMPQGSFEVIVVDNNSSPAVPSDIAGSRKMPVKLINELRQSGFAARNTGIVNSKGDILAFTDSDTVPSPDWLKKGYECLTDSSNAPFAGGNVEIELSEKPGPVEFFEFFYGFDQERYIRHLNFSVTANMFTTRELFIKTGGFSNELKSGGDREWGNRASKHGKGVYCKDAVVLHPARKDWNELALKIRRTLDGYFQINAVKKAGRLRLIPEIAGDMFPAKQFFELFFIKNGPLSWKAKAFCVLIRLKYYRSYLKFKFICGMKI